MGDVGGSNGCHIFLASGSGIGWKSDAVINVGSVDTILLRDGAPNTLALRNGAAAQRFNVYNSYLNAGVDYERIGIGDIPAITGNVGLYFARGGSGTAKGIYIWNDSNSSIVFSTNATNRWQILNTGHLHAWTDNQFDIGASGNFRPRNVYVGSSVFVGTGVDITGAGGLRFPSTGYGPFWATSTTFKNVSNGVLTISNFAENDFGRLNFGSAADTHPAIARDGAGIKFTGAAAGSTSHIKVPAVAVLSLPAAATAGVGARAFVNDALAPVFGSTVATGGAVAVPVYSDGSAWKVG